MIHATKAGPLAAIAIVATPAFLDAGPIGAAGLPGPVATYLRPDGSLATRLGAAPAITAIRRVALAAQRASVRRRTAGVVATALGTAALRRAGAAAFVLRLAEHLREVAAKLFPIAPAGTTGVVAALAMTGRPHGRRLIAAGGTDPWIALRQARGALAREAVPGLIPRAFVRNWGGRWPPRRFGRTLQ
jgi:hypothetical protein